MRRPKLVPAVLALVPLLFALVLAPALVLVLWPAGPAAAHDGKIKLAVAGDGATGVTVRATYSDGHALDTVLRLVLSATADGGRVVGPIQLNPAGEGQGFYSTGPVLSPGRWQVTVSSPKPMEAKVLVVVEARTAQTAPPAVRAADERPASASASTRWLWRAAGAALMVAAVATIAALLVRARRRT